MPFKLNISDKGKAWRMELEGEVLVGKSVGDRLEGKEIGGDFDGYEMEITGGSDRSGFPLSRSVEGIGLRRVLLTKGWGMRDSTKGMRRRKTVRGKVISDKTVQINVNVLKEGSRKLNEIFPEQNKAPEPEQPKVEEKSEKIEEVEKVEGKAEEEAKQEEVKEDNAGEKKEG